MSVPEPETAPPLARARRIVKAALAVALAVAPPGQPVSAQGQGEANGPLEAMLSAREEEMARSVDPRQREAVLARMTALETAPNAIGDSASDLVFTPLPPCRVVDTRVPTAGILSVGVPRPFLVAGSSAAFPNQGGSAGGCGVPVGATAAMLNLVATGSTGPGNLRAIAWTSATPVMPNAAIINFGVVSGLPALANGLAVPICDPAATTCIYDLYVQSFVSNTHFVVDVVGYFSSVRGILTGAQAPLEVSGASVRLSTAGCAPGSVWKWNGSSWACQVDANTTYSAASPLALSGTVFGLSATGCAAGYVWKWNGSSWACGPDVDTNTTYSAGTGLDLAGSTFSVDPTDFNSVPSGSFAGGYIDFSTSWTTIASQSIFAPVAGTVLAVAAGEMTTGGGSAAVQTVLTTVPGGTSGAETWSYMSDNVYSYTHPVAMTVVSVTAGSTTSVYWRAIRASGSTPYVRFLRPKIALVFIPS